MAGNGLELATAYISLTVSARGISQELAKALDAPIERAARDAGANIDRILTRAVNGMSLQAPKIVVPDLAAPEIGVPEIPEPKLPDLPTLDAPRVGMPEIPEPARISIPTPDAPRIDQPEIPEADTGRLLSGAKTAGIAAGAAVGAGLAVGFLSASNAEVSNDKLAAQLGIQDPTFAADLGKIAARVYTSNFGDGLGQVNEAIRRVLQGGLLPEDATNKQIQSVTEKVLGLADVFDQDLALAAAAAGQLIRTKLATDADEALDVITRGFQQGADKSGDLLDTLNEFGTQFRQLGLSAADATGILLQGLKAGARDTDIVGDAIKEFGLKTLEGAQPAADAFASLGLDATKMAQAVAAGGPAAKAGLGEVLDRLRALSDPLARTRVSFALFGTQAEDVQAALLGIDPSKAAAGLGEVAGAADQMNAIVGDNAAAAFETFKRKAELALAGVASKLGPVLDIAPALGGLALTGQALAGPLKAVGSGLLSVGKSAVTGAAGVISQTAAFIAQKVATIATAVATKAYTAAQWLLNAALTANPIGLVVAAIALLVAGIILAYKNSETFREIVQAAFEAVLGAAKAVGRIVTEVMGAIVGAFASVITWLKGNWDVILAVLTGPFGLAILIVRRFGDDIVNFFKALPGRITAIAGNIFGFLKDQATVAASWVGTKVAEVVGFFTGLPGRLAQSFVGLFDGMKEAFVSAINWILKKWNDFGIKLEAQLPFPPHKTIGFSLDTPNLPLLKLHQGGIVPGPRGAEVPALLQAGELVIAAAQVPEPGRRGLAGADIDINVTTAGEDRIGRDVRFELQNLVHLLGA